MALSTLQNIVFPCFLVGSALLFIFLEKRYPYNRGERTFRQDFWLDLIGYGIIQSYVMGLVISYLIEFIDNSAGGISRLKLIGSWPIWAQVVLFIIWHDLNTYLIHRSQHRSRWLWRTHEAHHACAHVDWLSGLRSHSLEILMYQTVEYLPVILLGAAPEVPIYKGMANAFYGMYIHSNVSWKMGKLLYVFNGPELHRWHHARGNEEAYDRNYATKFSFWDYLFGTVYWPKTTATDYGVDGLDFPKGYIRQHLHAFRKFLPSD